MTAAVQIDGPWLATFQGAAARRADEPEWLESLRAAAIDRFQERGWPTPRDEEWKYTSLAATVRETPRPLAPGATPDQARIQGFLDASRDYHRMVFVNGRFDAGLSQLSNLPEGVSVQQLSAAWDDAAVRETFEQRNRESANGAVDLNLALADHGAVVRVAAGTVVEAPIYLLHLGIPSSEGHQAHATDVVVAGAGSQVTVIESFVGIEPDAMLETCHTRLVAEENAILDYLSLVHVSKGATHLHEVHGRQARNSQIRTFLLDVAGELSRTEIEVDLAGEGAECSLKGLYLTHDDEQVDVRTVVNHKVPHCQSEQDFKGILDGRSSASFNGKIVVHEDAQKTDATQSNRNLLLSRDAVINTKPQLEIYADDVKCAHGATTGRLDETAIFYLRSRGIDRKAAEALLTYAFASELVESVRFTPLRQEIEEFLMARLPVRPSEGDEA